MNKTQGNPIPGSSAILATLCYIRKNGKVLMMHRNKKKNDPHEGKWNGVGGKLEQGESPRACAIREVKEETGFDAKTLKLHGVLTWSPNMDGRTWIGFVYSITEFEGELLENNEGSLEWIPEENVLKLNLWETDHCFLPKLFNDEFFDMHFAWDGTRLIQP